MAEPVERGGVTEDARVLGKLRDIARDDLAKYRSTGPEYEAIFQAHVDALDRAIEALSEREALIERGAVSDETTITLEVISGPEGPCLALVDGPRVTRIAGPKPWGGGQVIHTFRVKRSEFRKVADRA